MQAPMRSRRIYQQRHAASPRFQGHLPLSWISRMFLFFETQYEPGFILVSKVLGNAAPRIAITRNWDERKEVIFNETTQTAGFFLALPVGSALLNPVQSWFAGVPAAQLRMKNELALAKLTGRQLQNLKVAKLGKSLGVFAFIAFLKIAMPYIRNWHTIHSTGFSEYKDLVALGGKRTPTAEDLRKSEIANRKNIARIKALLATGIVSAFAIMAAAGAIVRGNGKALSRTGWLNPSRLESIFKSFALVGKNSNQVMSLTKSMKPTFWFWGVPSYVGWFLGCRDKYEFVEQISKFGTFIAGYMGTTPFMGAVMKRVDGKLLNHVKHVIGREALPSYEEVIQKNILKTPPLAKRYLKHLNTKNGMSLLLNLVVVGALPLIFNIYFSAWRYRREQALKQKNKNTDFKTYPTTTLPPLTKKIPVQKKTSPFIHLGNERNLQYPILRSPYPSPYFPRPLAHQAYYPHW